MIGITSILGGIGTLATSRVSQYAMLGIVAFFGIQFFVLKPAQRMAVANYALSILEKQHESSLESREIRDMARRPGAVERVRRKYCPKCKGYQGH